MEKALVISVGTGTIAQEEPIDSLAVAISKSVKLANADKTFFVVSVESEQAMLPKILEKTELQREEYELIHIKNPDDIRQTYEDLREKFQQIKQDYSHVVIDYTSGTKAMTGALIAQGILHEVDWFCYMSGKREQGRGLPMKGTEKAVCLQPFFVTAEYRIKAAIQFFNKHQFDACISLLNEIRKQTDDAEIISKFASLEKAAHAYSLWDRFQHEEAAAEMSKVKESIVDKNKRFLNILCRTQDREPYYIADLINNAKRRGADEGRFDDAIARLYRVIEFIAQYQLKRKYNINTRRVDPKDLPKTFIVKGHADSEADTPLRIAMDKAYELLHIKGDALGIKYNQDPELKDLLRKRNESILAHGHRPVAEAEYSKLMEKAHQYASSIIEDLNMKLEDATFPQWNTQ